MKEFQIPQQNPNFSEGNPNRMEEIPNPAEGNPNSNAQFPSPIRAFSSTYADPHSIFIFQAVFRLQTPRQSWGSALALVHRRHFLSSFPVPPASLSK
jgi:hypothetical protein